MSEKNRDILDARDKGISTAENLPAKLFRQVLYDLKMHPYKWGHLMRRYLTDPRNNVPQTKTDINHHRGNLNKELRKPRITFPTLMRGIRLLNPISMKLTVELTWPNRTTTVHSVDHILNRTPQTNEDMVSAIADEDDARIDY